MAYNINFDNARFLLPKSSTIKHPHAKHRRLMSALGEENGV